MATISEVFQRVMGPTAPIAFTAFDGSTAGPEGSDLTVHVRSPEAISYLLGSPGELGLPRAYASGSLDVTGDLFTVLLAVAEASNQLSLRTRLDVLRELGPRYLRPVTPPPEELPGRARRVWHGLRHSRARDDEAIAHHYDVSNRFYSYLLGPSMAYTCACYPAADSTLEQAQEHKFDLVCRKLGLRPGMRLLDVGCGWGGMVLHAARHYGVRALGVTLSRNQADWAQKAIVEAGLADVAEVRHGDYRDIAESGFDAVSSIGLTEHIGARNLGSYFTFLHSKLVPHGRLLNHCITRPTTLARARSGLFIDRYIFPDGELEGVGQIVTEMQNHGFEVRHEENLREHYARTLAGWSANLESNWDDAVRESGLGRSRVWRLYLAISRLGFHRRMIELHQVLGVRTADDGSSGMPLRPDWGV
ncbi:MAG TPA: cyclopropane-fatty-acyl-phospholipid synthase family protein [Pseudonocardiaceae bacterium]